MHNPSSRSIRCAISRLPGLHPLLLVMLTLAIAAIALAQPRIGIVGGRYVKMGQTYAGGKLIKELKLTNSGDDTLVINDIQTSCGCTVPKISSRRIAPHGAADLTIQFDSQGYQGEVQKEVDIRSNDPLMPELVMPITSEVYVLLQFSSRGFKFGSVKVHSSVTKSITVTNVGSDTVILIRPRNENPQLSFSLADTVLLPFSSTQLTGRLRPHRVGTLGGLVELKTDERWNLLFKIPYTAFVKK